MKKLAGLCLIAVASTMSMLGCAEAPQGEGAQSPPAANEPDSNTPPASNNTQPDEVEPLPDTDSDGLDDQREAELGTDPTLEDTDEDGYTDFEEDHAGTDPLDPSSRIYTGGWPYNPNKDALEDPGFESPGGLGTRLPRYKAIDQYGEEVDLYDFVGQGKPLVFDVGTWFCDPCKSLAEFLSTGDASIMDQWGWWREDFAIIHEMVENEEIFWVTVLFSKGTPVDHEDAALWHETFPNEKILVLADTDLTLQEHMQVEAMPRIDVLDQSLFFVSFNLSGPQNGMTFISSQE